MSENYNALARFLNSEKRAFEEPQMMVLPGRYEGGAQYNIFDPADTRIVSKEFYSNPKEGAAAAQMTSAGQQEDDALMETLRRYGLLY